MTAEDIVRTRISYTTQDVADLIGVTRETVQSYVRDGKLAPLENVKAYRFSGQSIIDFLKLEDLLSRPADAPSWTEKRKANAAAAKEALALGRR